MYNSHHGVGTTALVKCVSLSVLFGQTNSTRTLREYSIYGKLAKVYSIYGEMQFIVCAFWSFMINVPSMFINVKCFNHCLILQIVVLLRTKRAILQQKVQVDMFTHQRISSTCSSPQSDQSR